MKVKLCAAVAGAFLMSACASTGLKENFTSANPDAVVLVSMQYANWGLDPVDLDAKLATGKHQIIDGPSWVDTYRLKGESSKKVYGIKKIPSGTYALTDVYKGNGNAGTTTCIDHFAPVFDIKAGHVNLIPNLLFVLPAPPNADDVAAVKSLVAENEKIAAPVHSPEVIAYVDYKTEDKKRCKYRKVDWPIDIVKLTVSTGP